MLKRKISTATRILKDEGVMGLLRELRLKATRGLQNHRERRYDPTSIDHQKALKWFERRRSQYDKLIKAVIPYVDRHAVILDVGANIGFFTLLLAEKIQFRGTAYLFEPLPNLADLCRKTFYDTPYDVKVFNFGLSDQDCELDMCVAANGNIGWNTLIHKAASADMKKVPVRLRPFDSINLDVTPTFIKVDVEGSEFQVFRGMLNSLKNWKPLPTILCEVGWGRSHPAWEEEVRVFRELEEIGYTIYDLERNPVDCNTFENTTDVLFLPQQAQTDNRGCVSPSPHTTPDGGPSTSQGGRTSRSIEPTGS